MLMPRTTEISALSAHCCVPLGGWPVPISTYDTRSEPISSVRACWSQATSRHVP